MSNSAIKLNYFNYLESKINELKISETINIVNEED